MANDVSIIVSADLGDTLIKLDLAKHAVNDLGDASENTAAKQDAAAASTTFFETALGGLNSALTTSIPLFGGFSAPLIALPLLAVPAAAAVVALADAVGTLVAIAAALVAPLSVVTGLLGTLGLGFALAAKKAFGMHEDGLGKAIGGLKKQFDDLTTTLVGRFMPVFQFLIHNAHDALDFLGRIAKLPLDQAFRELAQKGIPAVTQFFEHIGHLAAKPIRLAFQIAFGQGKAAGEAQGAVAKMWNDFTNFLFGYTKTHPIRLSSGQVIKLDKTHVDGIFQPLIDWFNRHDFTKEGERIGRQLLQGLKPLVHPIGQFIIHVLEDATKTAVVGMLNAINPFATGTKQKVRELNDWISHQLVSAAKATWNTIRTHAAAAIHSLTTPLSEVRDWIQNKIGSAITTIVNKFGNVKSAIDTAKSVAGAFKSVLDKIAGFFSKVFTFHVNWPSPPSWLSAVLGGLGGGSSNSTAGRTGQGGNNGPSFRQGGNVVQHNTFHLTSTSPAAFSRHVREIGRELARQQHILAGGA